MPEDKDLSQALIKQDLHQLKRKYEVPMRESGSLNLAVKPDCKPAHWKEIYFLTKLGFAYSVS